VHSAAESTQHTRHTSSQWTGGGSVPVDGNRTTKDNRTTRKRRRRSEAQEEMGGEVDESEMRESKREEREVT
jgi:hypothetical protein